MRGEGGGKSKIPIGHRITPACAGRRQPRAAARPAIWDHPRVCGEKYHYECRKRQLTGSPPRVRGEARSQAHLESKPGITPACAGRRFLEKPTTATSEDHPRVCGEKTVPFPISPLLKGSPPRVRGEAYATRLPCALWRITPACAGRRPACFVTYFAT